MEINVIQSVLGVVDEFVAQVKALSLPPLGPEFQSLPSDRLHEALVAHRVVKRYEVPNAQLAALRKQQSIDAVLEYDSNGWVEFDYRRLPPSVRRDFLLSKDWLRNFFRDFKHLYTLRFPSNETYVSARGMTDLFHKLRDTRQWHISPDLVGYCVEILMRNRALLSVVKQRFREKYGIRGKQALRDLSRAWKTERQTWVGYRKEAIRFMFRACTSLTRVSRVTTVPKDNKSDRVITCEGLWTMVCQLSYAASLRSHMKRVLGFDLETRQDVHRALIRAGGATIDLSKASDSNWMCVLRELFPATQYRWLEKMRTGIFEVKTEDGVSYHPLRMFAPMGCGCTFEVMTLVLLSHVRVLDSGGSVFGDDIIIRQEKAKQLIVNLEAQGWRINNEKSFTEGNFRESCGAFADLRRNTLLLSYDFVRPTTLSECYTIAHKMLQVGNALPKGRLREIFVDYYARLHYVFPSDAFLEGWSGMYRASAGLTEVGFYYLLGKPPVRHTTAVTREIAKFWHRPVYASWVTVLREVTQSPKRLACPTTVCVFLRRGMSYDIPTGRCKPQRVRMDLEAGVRLTDVLLANVI